MTKNSASSLLQLPNIYKAKHALKSPFSNTGPRERKKQNNRLRVAFDHATSVAWSDFGG